MRITRQSDTLFKSSETPDSHYDWSDAASGGPEIEEWEDRYDLDEHERPQGVEVYEHGRLVDQPHEGGLGFDWDDNDRYPGYHKTITRSSGSGTLLEGHVIERNPNASSVSIEDGYGTGGQDSSLYPWAYTYYPPGASDREALHKGFNTLPEVLATHSLLSVYGHEHPRGQKALEGFGRWE